MVEPALVFIHVMKCGGTSVRAGLAMGVAGRRDGPEIFELDGRASKAAAGGAPEDDWRFRDALLPYVVSTLQPAIVLGHFRYRDSYAALADRARFVTVLRHPVDRLVSLYTYRRYKPGVDLPVKLSFEELISSGRWAIEGHRYVDTFCGRDGLDPRSAEAVAAAVTNLRNFAVVGSTTRLNEFAREVSARVAREITIPQLNTTPVPDGMGLDIDPEVLAQVRVLCEPDVQLYEQVIAPRDG